MYVGETKISNIAVLLFPQENASRLKDFGLIWNSSPEAFWVPRHLGAYHLTEESRSRANGRTVLSGKQKSAYFNFQTRDKFIVKWILSAVTASLAGV